jgi:hypothetical protein
LPRRIATRNARHGDRFNFRTLSTRIFRPALFSEERRQPVNTADHPGGSK